MGEVYRAKDGRLGRLVAIKILPSKFSADADRIRRFEQEARAAGGINHPNVLVIYDVGTHDGFAYLVSELLEGQTLRERLLADNVPTRKAMDYALQTARGLAAAHNKGIVHRDLKPENLFITTDGLVKILDFGLAKLTQREAGPGQSNAPTAWESTEPGAVMGTVGYMSPEQVRGEDVDHRGDIFSFGAIVYEMLSGARAFQCDTAVETMNAVLKEEPSELRPTDAIPAGLITVVRHCLEKAPDDRFQSAKDLGFALESLPGMTAADAAGKRTSSTTSSKTPRGWIASLMIASAAIIALAIPTLRHLREQAPSEVRLDIVTPSTAAPLEFALSPDGRSIAFVASGGGAQRLWLRSLDNADAQVLVGTDGASFPFWSPDSRSIGFFAAGKLYRVNVTGGPTQAIADASVPRGGAWNAEGTIVFCRGAIRAAAPNTRLGRKSCRGHPDRPAAAVRSSLSTVLAGRPSIHLLRAGNGGSRGYLPDIAGWR
jgi:serine/threonine protein kinase